ncbi:MAG: hypothetical protein ACI4SH_00975 [Candidatus Scatosoma sp.]
MDVLKKAQWIWTEKEAGEDEYAEFYPPLHIGEEKEKTVCRISCDGDYTLFLNGAYVASNQYGDFEHYKIYDEIDVTPFLHSGENAVKILVWHFGRDSQRYKAAKAGVIFEFAKQDGGQSAGTSCGEILAQSGAHTTCRKSAAYASGYKKIITNQLGFSFLYDARKESGPIALQNAVEINKTCVFFPRPVKKLTVDSRAEAETVKAEGNYYIIDLKKETVGLPVLEFVSQTEQKITVFWGEDLQEGHVRGKIEGRDFSFEYVAKKGENRYANYMLRVGCRYLEIYCENEITLLYAGVLPQNYSVKPSAVREELCFPSPTEKRIYDVCTRTLQLCLMEHYVDTPWREQCLYAYDSRNQALCGYYAFEGGNAAYARANLKLMGEDRRDDGLLSICYPCGADLTIPSFSLHYLTEMKEYAEYTGDLTLFCEAYPKICAVIDAFTKKRKNGLAVKFGGKNHWNFYDWSAVAEGEIGADDEEEPDLFINCLFIIALDNLKYLCEKSGKTFLYGGLAEETRARTAETFWNGADGAFSVTAGKRQYAVLGNALAVLSGVAGDAQSERVKALCEKIARVGTGAAQADGTAEKPSGTALAECSLSMKIFKYDALLYCDKARYRETVLNEIRADYKNMLDAGATSVWETAAGARDFNNAGSLCHGWSAIPIYYYCRLLRKKP